MTYGIEQKLRACFERPPDIGMTPIFPFGAVFCSVQHKIKSVMLQQAAAILVLQGKKLLTLGAEQMVIPAGRMFMLPAQVEFAVENRPSPETGQYLALCLTFTEDMLARAVADESGRPPVSSSRLASFNVAFDTPLSLAVAHLLDMARYCPQNETLFALCQQTVLTLVADRTTCLPYLWSRSGTWRARCALMLGLTPGHKWTVVEAAERLGVSERGLRRHLSAEDVGFREILQDVRLNAGLVMLQSGSVNVGEAAYRCGYESASRFAGLFRERFGVSPGEVIRFNAVSGQQLAV